MIRKIPFLPLLLLPTISLGQGSFTGDLMLNTDFYIKDSAIGALRTPHYDNLLSGTDAWLTLNYSISGFTSGIRLDLFNNSNLHNPGVPYSSQGIGAWFIAKKIDELTVTGGYIYDQFGSGSVFRSYEDRGLGIDNAIFGIQLKYELRENISIRGFTGRQKDLFSLFNPVIKGANIEGSFSLSDSMLFSITPGFSFVNRTMDQGSMDPVVSEINSYPLEDRFYPKYNVYLFQGYNTLNYKNISWYVEYAAKSDDVFRDFSDSLRNGRGSFFNSTATWSRKGFGITLQYRRNENFSFRTSPNQLLLKGLVNFLPPVARQNSYRLVARYNAATQGVGEQGFQADIVFSPVKWLALTINYSEIAQLENQWISSVTPPFKPDVLPETNLFGNQPWFREFYFDAEMRRFKKITLMLGAQYLNYNQDFYENKPGVPVLEAVTPFTEITWKITRKRSIRSEFSYMFTTQDFGEWLFALAEYSIAPRWSFGFSDMYNIKPQKTSGDNNYVAGYASFTKKATRFMLSYVKQVEGIVCTGGVCRYEPAFSGVRLSVTTSF